MEQSVHCLYHSKTGQLYYLVINAIWILQYMMDQSARTQHKSLYVITVLEKCTSSLIKNLPQTMNSKQQSLQSIRTNNTTVSKN